MATETVAKAKLTSLDTSALIAQYELAISSYEGRGTNCSPRQTRIDYIVNIISNRADDGDTIALAWYEI